MGIATRRSYHLVRQGVRASGQAISLLRDSLWHDSSEEDSEGDGSEDGAGGDESDDNDIGGHDEESDDSELDGGI